MMGRTLDEADPFGSLFFSEVWYRNNNFGGPFPIGLNIPISLTINAQFETIAYYSEVTPGAAWTRRWATGGNIATTVVLGSVDVIDAINNGTAEDIAIQTSGLVGGVAGGYIGGLVGAAAVTGILGSAVGPFGTAVGAVVGATAFAIGGEALVQQVVGSILLGEDSSVSHTAMLAQSIRDERTVAINAAYDDSVRAYQERIYGAHVGSEVRLYDSDRLPDTSGPRGMGFDPRDPRGPWQDPGIAYTPPGQKPRGWNDPDGHPASSGSQGLGGGNTSQDSSRSSDRDDRPIGKAPPPPLTPKYVPRDTDDYGRTRDEIAFVGAHPVLLDLDGDGIEITELDRATIVVGTKSRSNTGTLAQSGIRCISKSSRNGLT